MANITRKRTGEFLRIVLKLLLDKPEGLPAKEVLAAIPQYTTLTEFELGFYNATPNSPRFEKIVRFGTIGMVKAGWLVKTKGRWYITEEGKQAYQKFTDPEALKKEIDHLYQVWRRNRPPDGGDEADGGVIEKITITIEEAQEKAWEQINQFLQDMNPYAFQDMVADLLKAMGYYITWIAPPGKDRGIDIIAFTDPLGAIPPRIKVQVKHQDNATPVQGLRAFMAVLGSDEIGLFVSSGGFTADAKEEARTQERRRITLLDLEQLFDLWVQHYEKLTQEARQRFPLQPIYFLAPIE